MSQRWITLRKRRDGTWDAIYAENVIGNFAEESEARWIVDTINEAIDKMAHDFIVKKMAEWLPEIIDKNLKERKRESTR